MNKYIIYKLIKFFTKYGGRYRCAAIISWTIGSFYWLVKNQLYVANCYLFLCKKNQINVYIFGANDIYCN